MTNEPTSATDAQAAVDVVILCLNRIQDTLAAIESALTQTGVRQRIILVDQGSAPENLERLQQKTSEDPAIILHPLGYNHGVPAGRNIGSALGNSPFICFLDSDAVFAAPDVLSTALNRFQKDAVLGAVALRIIIAGTGQDQNQEWLHPGVVWRDDADGVTEVTRFIGAGAILRREAFDAVGGFDERLFFMEEERDIGYRLLNEGWLIRCFSDLRVYHRLSPIHRHYWRSTRYYYLVRNNLFCRYKRGEGMLLLAPPATFFLVRGIGSGLGGKTLRAILASIAMIVRYRRLTPCEQRRRSHLRPEIRHRIRQIEKRPSYHILTALHRVLKPLSNRIDTAVRRTSCGGR